MAYGEVNRKRTFTEIQNFDEAVSALLAKIHREDDEDDYGLLCLSQDPLECNTLTGSILSRLINFPAYDTDIDSDAIDGERKQAEVKWKVKLNDVKVQNTAERGAKKMLLSVFDDTHTNRLKHHVKQYAVFTCYDLTHHLRKHCMKLHQLNISELMIEMSSYFEKNE